MIILLPIEPLEERYSKQWLKWFETEFKNNNIPYTVIDPYPLSDKIESGTFLDVCGTNYYKALQLAELARGIRRGDIINGDIIFLHDLWFPGLEMIAYMRDALGLNIKIVGCLHAGTYDPTDFVSQKWMGFWGKDLENSWFKIVDKVFVGSEYHRNLVLRNREISEDKIVNTGFPIYWNREIPDEKENVVIFPHRLAPEKRPDLFDKLAKRFKNSGWKFIKSQKLGLTKEEYYNLLGKSKIAISFSEHENFGIAMREALFSGCIPIVPNTLCYPEFFNRIFCYEDYKDCSEFMNDITQYPKKYNLFEPYRKESSLNLLRLGQEAIGNMIRELEI